MKENDKNILIPSKREWGAGVRGVGMGEKCTFCYQMNFLRPLRYFLVSSSFKTLGMSGCLEKVHYFEMVCTDLTYIFLHNHSFLYYLFTPQACKVQFCPQKFKTH